MNQRTRIFIRYIFIIILGVIAHAAYGLSQENPIVRNGACRDDRWQEPCPSTVFPPTGY